MAREIEESGQCLTLGEGHFQLEDAALPDGAVLAGNGAFPLPEVEDALGVLHGTGDEAEGVVLPPLLTVINEIRIIMNRGEQLGRRAGEWRTEGSSCWSCGSGAVRRLPFLREAGRGERHGGGVWLLKRWPARLCEDPSERRRGESANAVSGWLVGEKWALFRGATHQARVHVAMEKGRCRGACWLAIVRVERRRSGSRRRPALTRARALRRARHGSTALPEPFFKRRKQQLDRVDINLETLLHQPFADQTPCSEV